MTERHSSLYFQQGSSDKEYHAQIIKESEGYLVLFQYGRTGSALKPGVKTLEPVSLEEAIKIWEKLIKSKISKGYVEGGTKAEFTKPLTEKIDSGIYPQLLNEVNGDELASMIINDDFIAQEKFDGERRLVRVTDKATGINKKGIEVPIPDAIAASIQVKCIIDTEIVADTLYVFDILSFQGKSVTNKAYEERLKLLESISFGANVKVCKTIKGTKAKKVFLDKLKEDNKEGIVLKKSNHQYLAGRPNSGGDVFKFKFYKTATVRVSNHTKGKRSVGMEMLDGDLVMVGKVTIPTNKEVPAVGAYIEVRYLYAYPNGGALFQPIYLGERNDQNESDIEVKQLVFKNT